MTDIEKLDDVKYVESVQHLEQSTGGDKNLPLKTAIEGNVHLLDADGKTRLIPVPSGSPRDPLNFSKYRKWGILATCIWFSCMALTSLTSASSLAPIFFGIYARQGVAPDEISRLFTWPSLFTGVANFLFLPLCLVLGRRPSFILAAILLIAGCVWAAKSGTSFESHLGARILMGFAAGATESILPLILSDYTFVHERAAVFGLFSFLVAFPQAALTIAASYEAVLLSWQWFYWIFLILSALGMLMVIFLVPETKFERPAFLIDGEAVRVDEFGNVVPMTENELKEQAKAAGSQEDERPVGKYSIAFGFRTDIKAKDWKTVPKVYYQMLLCLTNPAIVWALGLGSIALSIIIYTSLTWGNILVRGYGWSEKSVGLNAIGAIPAGVFAFVVAGWGGDKISMLLARRNGGLHTPEHRLPSLIVPGVLGIVFLIMYGVFGHSPQKYHWFAIVFAGNALQGCLVSFFIVTTTYCVEVLPRNAGAALVMVVGAKNLVSFGVASGFADKASHGEVRLLSFIFTGVLAGWLLLGAVLYFYVGRFRQWRAEREVSQ